MGYQPHPGWTQSSRCEGKDFLNRTPVLLETSLQCRVRFPDVFGLVLSLLLLSWEAVQCSERYRRKKKIHENVFS